MKVKALRDGFYGGSRRRADTEFDFEGKTPGKWMEVIVADEKAAAKPKAQKAKGEGPQTFGDIAKQEAKDLAPKGSDDLV